MTSPTAAVLREQLNRLREVMPEDEIFIPRPEGGIALSPKAARRLGQMAADDAETWRERHRDQAAEAAANILNRFQGEAA